ncbi:4-amino-4-deoxychorismate lyase [Vibrio ichthyoenteri ATCC 700023]|uniref:Aminodeoxychorismate lyase n=1 Tax=Vibrio ichthyoenteri ATCC 700023 TaxID=870968 RepID=F9S6F3_9VIBR|nr:aminodeoxychorismate lyase [Vibrio ichthyoenteri]EGU33300.1 4-amino-4-deoxychorismate lyase [Vibrio ichthyoenteri ATCC 700023]
MFWLNGQPTDSISLLDRSFQYGDGGFTTILTEHGKLCHWPYHKQRMQACLRVLAIVEPDWFQVEQWLTAAANMAPLAGLKLHISRGEGGRGYSPTQVSAPNVTISDFAYPTHYQQWQQQGIALGISQIKLGLNPLLAGHKHNNRLEQILVKADLEQAGFADGLVLNINDHVIETGMANLFWRKGEVLYTPQLDMSGVAGVARRRVIEWAKDDDIVVEIGQFDVSHLLEADEVFITNSLLGTAPIRAIESQTFPIGMLTRRIQEKLFP